MLDIRQRMERLKAKDRECLHGHLVVRMSESSRFAKEMSMSTRTSQVGEQGVGVESVQAVSTQLEREVEMESVG